MSIELALPSDLSVSKDVVTNLVNCSIMSARRLADLNAMRHRDALYQNSSNSPPDSVKILHMCACCMLDFLLPAVDRNRPTTFKMSYHDFQKHRTPHARSASPQYADYDVVVSRRKWAFCVLTKLPEFWRAFMHAGICQSLLYYYWRLTPRCL